MKRVVGGLGILDGGEESVEGTGARATREEAKLDSREVAGPEQVSSEAVVDSSRHDFEGGFKKGDWARVGEGLWAGFGDKDQESLEDLGREGGPAEAGVTKHGVSDHGVSWALAEETSGEA